MAMSKMPSCALYNMKHCFSADRRCPLTPNITRALSSIFGVSSIILKMVGGSMRASVLYPSVSLSSLTGYCIQMCFVMPGIGLSPVVHLYVVPVG